MSQNVFIERCAVQKIFATLAVLFFGVGFSVGSSAQSSATRSETIDEYRAELERLVNEVRNKGVVPSYVAQSPAIIFDAKRLIALGDQLLAAPTHRPLGQTLSLLLPIIPLFTPTYDQKTLKRAKEYFAFMEVQTVGLEISGIRGSIDWGKAMPDDPETTKLVQRSLCERPYATADFNLNMLASELDSGRLSAEDSAFAAAVVDRLRNRKRWYESDAHVSVCRQLDKIVIAPELTARVDENPNRPKPSPPEPPSQAAKELDKILETFKRIEKQKAAEDPFKVAERQFATQEWKEAESTYLRVINDRRPSAFWEDERIAIVFARLAEIRLIAGKPLEAEKFSRQAIELLDRPESSAYAALAYGLETLAVSLRRTKREKEADEADDRVRKLRKLLER